MSNNRIKNRLYYREVVPEPAISIERLPHDPRELAKQITEERVRPLTPQGINVMDGITITRPFRTTTLTITTSPQKILIPPHPNAYLVSNPALTVGLTSTVTVYSGTVNAAGNTQASPVGVANYIRSHFHINVTAVTGEWEIIGQTRDPISGNWADITNLYSGINATGTYYSSLGELGIVSDFAVRWNPVAAGSITFSLAMTLKVGAPGSGGGLARTIYLGGSDITTTNGYPLFEGRDRVFVLGEEVELWALSEVSTTLKVFSL